MKGSKCLIYCRWLSVIDDSPGLCKNAILDLGERCRLDSASYKNCCLVIDAMGLKKQILYSQKEKRLVGESQWILMKNWQALYLMNKRPRY